MKNECVPVSSKATILSVKTRRQVTCDYMYTFYLLTCSRYWNRTADSIKLLLVFHVCVLQVIRQRIQDPTGNTFACYKGHDSV